MTLSRRKFIGAAITGMLGALLPSFLFKKKTPNLVEEGMVPVSQYGRSSVYEIEYRADKLNEEWMARIHDVPDEDLQAAVRALEKNVLPGHWWAGEKWTKYPIPDISGKHT